MLVGIDIGGTAIKAGLVGSDGVVTARAVIPFDQGLSFDGLVALLGAAVERLGASSPGRISAIGLCLPGFVDRITGMLIDGGANVPTLREKPLALWLGKTTGLPVFIENDGVAATVGEARFGAGRGLKRFALTTIGTGIGGGVFIDRAVVTGSRGEPPELGAIAVQIEEGCTISLEQLACANAFIERYRRYAGRAIDSLPNLFAKLADDPAAKRTVEEIGEIIARALSPMVNALNLEACLIGGGVAAAGEHLLAPIRSHLPRFTWPMLARNCRVLQAECGNDAGLLGAAWLAQDAVGLHA